MKTEEKIKEEENREKRRKRIRRGKGSKEETKKKRKRKQKKEKKTKIRGKKKEREKKKEEKEKEGKTRRTTSPRPPSRDRLQGRAPSRTRASGGGRGRRAGGASLGRPGPWRRFVMQDEARGVRQERQGRGRPGRVFVLLLVRVVLFFFLLLRGLLSPSWFLGLSHLLPLYLPFSLILFHFLSSSLSPLFLLRPPLSRCPINPLYISFSLSSFPLPYSNPSQCPHHRVCCVIILKSLVTSGRWRPS